MSNRPPVDLDELMGEGKEVEEDGDGEARKAALKMRLVGKEKPQKRKLGYASGGGGGKLQLGRGGGGRGGFGGGLAFNKENVLLVLIAALLAISAGLFIFARRNDHAILLENQQTLQTSINKEVKNREKTDTRVDNIIASYATTKELNAAIDTLDLSGYITASEMNTAIAGISTHNSVYGYLTKPLDTYTLNVEGNPGTYIARVSLIYTTPYSLGASNISEAYEVFSSNWTGRDFIPEFTGAYEVSSASFYTGTFEMTGETWSGPLATFSAVGSYVMSVEIMPALKPVVEGGGGGGGI